MKELVDLLQVVTTLRAPGGCPWDRKQTLLSMRPYLLEETYEVLHCIDNQDNAALQAELGDLLFILLMLATMAEEAGDFSLQDVARQIHDKMVRRHPDVFGAQDPNTASLSWEERKAQERASDTQNARSSALDGVPKALPALLRAHRITEKASNIGFDWPDLTGARNKLDEEINELDEALESGDEEAIIDEFGDVLFTLVNLGRFLPARAEDALRKATARFEERFRHIEEDLAAQGTTVYEADMEHLEKAWQEAKQR